MTLDPFYPIFDSSDWLHWLLPCGVKLVQLRVKDRSEVETRREIRTAKGLCDAAGCQLVINDYWRLAIDEGCDFVHLGQEDLDSADLTAIRRAGLRLGVSTHDDAELERALATGPDYIALGPVYPTILKKMKWDPQGLGKVTDWKRRIGEVPLVAIGGLTVERAPGVLAAGADILSVVTDITLNAEPEARTRAWVEVTHENELQESR
ncbi:thiamine phosphate synthase [Pelagibius sp. CAU 1746]|uniref:thiamine phosphate synthase n=1 Tax=Pelagibius sp. CAU 1746 TaxID=3140370 RepID=UPI00325A51C9